jgi:hypothetical protein
MSESEEEVYDESWDEYLEDLDYYKYTHRLDIFRYIQNTSMNVILQQKGLLKLYWGEFKHVFKDNYTPKHDVIMDDLFDIVEVERPITFLQRGLMFNKYDISRMFLWMITESIDMQYMKEDLYRMVATNPEIEELLDKQCYKK